MGLPLRGSLGCGLGPTLLGLWGGNPSKTPSKIPKVRSIVAHELFEAPECCLDVHCSRKVKAAFASAEELMCSEDMMKLILAWARQARVCNMHVERLFAQIRQAAPQRKPFAERVCVAGLVTQINHAHRQAGGVLPSSFRRKDLHKLDAPVASKVDSANHCPQRARGHILFMTRRLREEAAKLPKGARLSKEQQKQLRRAAAEQFRLLSEDERRKLTQQAQEQAATHALEDPAPESQRRYDASSLWGVAERDSPLASAVAEDIVKKMTGVSKVVAHLGVA